jgi:hypothetical protein
MDKERRRNMQGIDIEQIKTHAKVGAKWRRWSPLLILGFWTLLGLLYASQHYLGFESVSWWRLAAWQLLVYYVWAALTPLILWLGQRLTFERPNRMRSIAAHILSGSVIYVLHILSYTYITLSARGDNGRLQLKVYNDGPSLPPNWRIEDCQGIGLANTRARIEQYYGSESRLEVRNCGGRGVEATLR